MWIEKLKSGRYRAVERYTEIMTGKQKKVSVTMDKNTAASRKAAEAALIRKITELNTDYANTEITFSQLVAYHREYQKINVKKSTYRRNYYMADELMNLLGRDTLVSKLNAGYVIRKINIPDKTPAKINEQYKRLKALLRWGYENDYVRDVSWLVKLKPVKDEKKVQKLSEKYLESEELKILLDNIKVERWENLTLFLTLTGMRLGEAFALDYTDIDLKERQIRVTKNYDPNNDLITTTKNVSSTRDVFIQDELLPLCRKLKSAAATERLIKGNGKVFSPSGNSYRAYEKYFAENTTSLFGRKLTPHALRHTHVALLAEQGIPLETISRRLGHSNSKVTREVYFHVTKQLKKREDSMLRNIALL